MWAPACLARTQTRQVNEVRLHEAQAHHARMVAEVTAANRKRRDEYEEKVQARQVRVFAD